jgi:hypothetical protein
VSEKIARAITAGAVNPILTSLTIAAIAAIALVAR